VPITHRVDEPGKATPSDELWRATKVSELTHTYAQSTGYVRMLPSSPGH